jgi:hypothetical protein
LFGDDESVGADGSFDPTTLQITASFGRHIK